MDKWHLDWWTIEDDRLITPSPPLTSDERLLLSQGVWIWGGPTRTTDDLARALGWPDEATLLAQKRALALKINDDEPLTKAEWAIALRSLEVAWASSYYGAGGEWDIVTPWTDEKTLSMLRSIQRTLGGLRAPHWSSLPQ